MQTRLSTPIARCAALGKTMGKVWENDGKSGKTERLEEYMGGRCDTKGKNWENHATHLENFGKTWETCGFIGN